MTFALSLTVAASPAAGACCNCSCTLQIHVVTKNAGHIVRAARREHWHAVRQLQECHGPLPQCADCALTSLSVALLTSEQQAGVMRPDSIESWSIHICCRTFALFAEVR